MLSKRSFHKMISVLIYHSVQAPAQANLHVSADCSFLLLTLPSHSPTVLPEIIFLNTYCCIKLKTCGSAISLLERSRVTRPVSLLLDGEDERFDVERGFRCSYEGSTYGSCRSYLDAFDRSVDQPHSCQT